MSIRKSAGRVISDIQQLKYILRSYGWKDIDEPRSNIIIGSGDGSFHIYVSEGWEHSQTDYDGISKVFSGFDNVRVSMTGPIMM